MTMTWERYATVEHVLASCQTGFVPVNVMPDVAIAAHREALRQRADHQVRLCALRAVVLAATPEGATDSRRILDYLESVPAAEWLTVPREATLNDLRRTIGWQIQD